MCSDRPWYFSTRSASVSLYWNSSARTERCQIASRHAGVTAVAPAVALKSQGVPATMYGDAKESVSLIKAESCERPSVVEKNLLGMSRVPSSISGPTAYSVR